MGDLLFHTPDILGDKARAHGISCNTCHPNGATNPAFFLEGKTVHPGSVDLTSTAFREAGDDGIFNPIRIPSLRGARHRAIYGFDGRSSSLKEFVESVITLEFGGAPARAEYLHALRAYVQSLDFLSNRNIDRFGRLTASATDQAKRGESVFRKPMAGLAGNSCSSCHVPETFFHDGKVHRRPTGTGSSTSLDDGIRTASLVGSVEYRSYFHDGRFATLAEVVAWYVNTWGLAISTDEQGALESYLQAIGAVDRPKDDRPLVRALAEDFVYLQLLTAGAYSDDRNVWQWALRLVQRNLKQRSPPKALSARVEELSRGADRLAVASKTSANLASLRPAVRSLQEELSLLAREWAGEGLGSSVRFEAP